MPRDNCWVLSDIVLQDESSAAAERLRRVRFREDMVRNLGSKHLKSSEEIRFHGEKIFT
jgi:hypothetical protein